MKVKQISVFLENKPGRLVKVTELLGKNNINIRALSVADTTDFGILRLIVTEPDRTSEILKEEGFAYSLTDVIAVEVPDNPGGLAGILAYLEENKINIEYVYAFLQKSLESAIVVFRVEDLNGAIKILQSKQVKILENNEVYAL